MSWYFLYHLAWKNPEDGKLYPLGPFDDKGKFYPVVEKSRSFASDLHEEFIDIRSKEDRKKLISKELFKQLYSEAREEEFYGEVQEDNAYSFDDFYISYLPYKDLPKGNYIKKGYYLIEDIERYEDPDFCFDGFYDKLNPTVYAKKLENELKFGRPRPEKDAEGYDITPHSVADYSYYCYPDYESAEYESYCIREVAEILTQYSYGKDERELYVVLTQG